MAKQTSRIMPCTTSNYITRRFSANINALYLGDHNPAPNTYNSKLNKKNKKTENPYSYINGKNIFKAPTRWTDVNTITHLTPSVLWTC